MSYKVEFLTTALTVDGTAEWVSNAYRYRTAEEAVQHFAYLSGQSIPTTHHRAVKTEDPVNAAFEDGKSSRVVA